MAVRKFPSIFLIKREIIREFYKFKLRWGCLIRRYCKLEALIYLLDNIYIRFGTKLYRQIVGIPMGTNCAPLVADFFFILL